MSKLQVCADWSRPSPSSPRLPVLGSLLSDLTVGPDCTEPYLRPGPSGLVESLAYHLSLRCDAVAQYDSLYTWFFIGVEQTHGLYFPTSFLFFLAHSA